ncbi:MAG: SusC/RagA family TonB-linked outer membrane protein, partial [Salinivirgaceae bacterium]|nr:SusC/RagA family TonB-linked outer membrane protein [Salinivirgaceae bacterium]
MLERLMKIFLLIVSVFCTINLNAQDIILTGKVRDKSDSQSLPGVNVMVKGTLIGTVTNFDGNFTLKLNEMPNQIEISFIGYQTQIVDVNNKMVFNIELELDAAELDEVVVTALGIKRDKKSLGYAVQEIKSDELNAAKDVNVINQLAGKVAGLRITSTTGGPGSSSRVVLRGNTSLDGDNQALIVVDGVAIDNSTSNSTGQWGGFDFGSGINDINSEDIESVSVLKGASAAALYGSRASNGVIIISTKKGSKSKGLGISFSTNTTFENAYILTDFQNEYGAGRNGKFEGAWEIKDGIPVFNTNSALSFGSWGPKMEGQTIIDWDGKQKTFDPQPNNYKDYFRTGVTSTNSLSVQNSFDKLSFRFSYSNLFNEDIVPNTNLRKNMFSVNSSYSFNSKLTANYSISYTNQKAQNRLGLSNSLSAPRNIIMMPRHISDGSLKNNMENTNGEEQVWYTNWGWMTNPYFYHSYNLNHDTKNRIISGLSLNYSLNENISAMIRGNVDAHNMDMDLREAYNSFYNPQGNYTESNERFKKYQSDVLLSFNKDISEDLKISGNAGGSFEYWKRRDEYQTVKDTLNGPYEYIIPNNSNVKGDTNVYEKLVTSIYATAQVSYKNYLFLDATIRKDWSSTLPAENRGFSYPSLSLGYVFTDHLQFKSSLIPYGKLRLSVAKVGSDSDPYKLQKTYVGDENAYEMQPMSYVTRVVPLANMKPEMTTSYEVGTDLRFFDNRIAVDFSAYWATTKDQILETNISAASGSPKAVINTGEVQNNGIELQLNFKVIKTKDFKWNMTLNYAKNYSKVVALDQGLNKYELLNQWTINVEARPGHPYGDIV